MTLGLLLVFLSLCVSCVDTTDAHLQAFRAVAPPDTVVVQCDAEALEPGMYAAPQSRAEVLDHQLVAWVSPGEGEEYYAIREAWALERERTVDEILHELAPRFVLHWRTISSGQGMCDVRPVPNDAPDAVSSEWLDVDVLEKVAADVGLSAGARDHVHRWIGKEEALMFQMEHTLVQWRDRDPIRQAR